jgi:hypothetical protein
MTGSACSARVELFSTTAGAIFILHRRTSDRTVRTKDTAVARLRTQQRFAVRAFVEKLACAGRHWLSLREAANRAHTSTDSRRTSLIPDSVVDRRRITRVRSRFG